jgi:hypothetical protein
MGAVRDAIDPSGNFNPAKVLPVRDGVDGTHRGPGMLPLPAEGMWV